MLQLTSFFGAALVLVASLSVTTDAAELCTSAVWDTTDGDWLNSNNWVSGAVPTATEVAVIQSDADAVITVDSSDVAARALILEDENVIIEIGGDVPVWLVIGEEDPDEISSCIDDSDCLYTDNLTLPAGYRSTPVGSGVLYDTDNSEVVETDQYVWYLASVPVINRFLVIVHGNVCCRHVTAL